MNNSITDILNILLKSIFVGFGFVIPLLVLIKTKKTEATSLKEVFITSAIQLLIFSGIVYFILAAKDAYFLYFNNTSHKYINVQDNNYLFYLLFQPFVYLLLSQVFWIKKLRIKKIALITFSLLLLIVPSQWLFAIFTSFHKDYLPSSMSMNILAVVLEVVLNIVVFIFINITIMAAKGKLKPKAN